MMNSFFEQFIQAHFTLFSFMPENTLFGLSHMYTYQSQSQRSRLYVLRCKELRIVIVSKK